MDNKKLTINNIHKIEGKVLLITIPLNTNLITGGRGLATRCQIHNVEIGDGVYHFRLDDTYTDYITLWRNSIGQGNTRYISIRKDGQSYSARLNADFLKTPELFIAGLENTTWDDLPF